MANFGVLEVSLHTAPQGPGWAYVPDIGINNSVAAHQPAGRKRQRTELTSHESTAKQDAKILRDILALEKDSHKDVTIPIPPRPKDNLGRASQSKPTPGVRKILQSQKTFANHLADYEAGALLPAPPPPVSRASTSTPILSNTQKRSHKKKDPSAPSPLHKVSPSLPLPNPLPSFSPMLSLGSAAYPPPHPKDDDPLLRSRIPALPSEEELQRLVEEKPLSWGEARGAWVEEDRRRPVRRFCEVCGFWGRVRCGRCGGRVCALECLSVHKEDCFTRYGA